jgi:hypothetical protein
VVAVRENVVTRFLVLYRAKGWRPSRSGREVRAEAQAWMGHVDDPGAAGPRRIAGLEGGAMIETLGICLCRHVTSPPIATPARSLCPS